MGKLPENLKVRIKQMTHNSIVVLTVGSSEALKPAQALASSLMAYAKDHGIVNCNIVLTTPQVGVSVLDEGMMRTLGWVKVPPPEFGLGIPATTSSRALSAADAPRALAAKSPQPLGAPGTA